MTEHSVQKAKERCGVVLGVCDITDGVCPVDKLDATAIAVLLAHVDRLEKAARISNNAAARAALSDTIALPDRQP